MCALLPDARKRRCASTLRLLCVDRLLPPLRPLLEDGERVLISLVGLQQRNVVHRTAIAAAAAAAATAATASHIIFTPLAAAASATAAPLTTAKVVEVHLAPPHFLQPRASDGVGEC